jgi:hypothetical protein
MVMSAMYMTFSEVDTSRFRGMVSLLLLLRKKNGDVCHVYSWKRKSDYVHTIWCLLITHEHTYSLFHGLLPDCLCSSDENIHTCAAIG